MTKIKFCGLRTLRDVGFANEIRPDYVGFVLAKRFWRHVSYTDVQELKNALRPDISAVGVFVDNPFEEVAELLERGVIDLAQLHGSEDDNFIMRLKDRTGRPVIKAFKIGSEKDIERAVRCPSDYLLLDSGTGTGVSFDWSLIRNLGRDYFLAGGLTPYNVVEAIERLNPFAVDVSSGIESEKIKDLAKMRAFAEAVKSTNKGE